MANATAEKKKIVSSLFPAGRGLSRTSPLAPRRLAILPLNLSGNCEFPISSVERFIPLRGSCSRATSRFFHHPQRALLRRRRRSVVAVRFCESDPHRGKRAFREYPTAGIAY